MMSHEHSNDSTDFEVAGDSSRDPVPVRPEGRVDDVRNPEADAATKEGRQLERDDDPRSELSEQSEESQLAQINVQLSQMNTHLQENHFHQELATPNPVRLAELRERAPEVYQAYVNGINKSVEADYIARTAPYTAPIENARSGRRYGLAAVLAAFVLVGLALHYDHPWIAGIIASLNLVGLVTVFGNPGSTSKNPPNAS